MDKEKVEQIGHLLKGIAQKKIGIRELKHAAERLDEGIERDHDKIWKIVDEDRENGKEENNE